MASPLSPLQHATLNNDNIPNQPTPAFDDYDVVHVSSVTTTHILADKATTASSTNQLPPFVFPSPTKDIVNNTDVDFDMATMDTSANSSPFMNSVIHTEPAHHDNSQHNSSSQENVSPHPNSNSSPSHNSMHNNNNINNNTKPVPPPVITSTAPPPTMSGRQGRPGSRIMSGSELSPLKILQGRVAVGPPSSSATSTATMGSPASPDSGAESRRDTADDQASSAASSPPPTYPPSSRRMSSSSNQMLPPALPLGRTPRKFTGPEKRFPVKISVPPVASAAVSVGSVASSGTASPVGPRSPMQQPAQLAQLAHHAPQPVASQLSQPAPESPSQPGQAMFASIQQQQKSLHGRQMSLDEAIQLNEGLKQAIEIFEDETSVIENDAASSSHGSGHSEDGNTQKQRTPHPPQRRRDSFANTSSPRNSPAPEEGGVAGMDDTMASTFSTFSAVPNAAMMSRLSRGNSTHGSNSPSKPPPPHNGFGHHTAARSRSGSMSGPSGPTSSVARTPRANGTTNGTGHGTANHGGPAPNRNGHYEPGNTASLLMDFTEQLRMAHNAQLSPSKERFGPQLTANGTGATDHASATSATPQRKSLVNLLDFEIPPMPTPRSIPTVTPRELESLKSNFLSEISSLKATLSGKEAEVLALKTAVGDAEKRVGECMEQLREERGARDLLSEEKGQWERRGREMEEVLRKVKGEIVMGHRDRDELEAKLDESDKRREAAEMMAQEAETKMAAMRAGRATGSPGGSTSSAAGSGGSGTVQREVEIAVERVARELHVAYKAKHEAKVAALKKSYEARWEKRVHELETVAEALAQENDKLRIGRDATLSKVVPGEEERRAEEERREREARDATQIKELGAEVNKLEAVLRSVKADNAELRTLLEQERVEKGELVSLAEEMMSMQQSFIASSSAAPPAPAAAATPATARRQSTVASSGYGQSMSPRKPKTPAPASRTSMSGISRPPSSTGHRNSMAMDGAASNIASNIASTATTPARTRPMSMHGTGGRVSGLKPPSSSTMSTGGVPSRIGRIGHDRKMSGSAGSLPRPPSGLGTRSGLMSSIEKMGNRGRE
ncbi:uncharacterized protein SPSK_06956 [Sporothrix schenckii 1099-18]|uniref:Uncharacterized protein n=2 Tax=Sporothrix schenckii TaxID=29908 RepID=U7Q4G1_SPOS1|nr:uncharacterized protein SPSK_06956 [Sporothrix schenckii 1099-18]ERT01601.1 hypothetical protein HMPREF1624_02852 [Sporothrix schenckii ATCC 58251]KJR88827.1 hypothetical protein SPSK_06956 [Sporothrix schenckii 1099-18]